MVRALTWLIVPIVLAGLGWSSWWLLGARGQEAALEAWLEGQRDRGWQAEAASIEVTGFPAKFRTAVREIALADPDSGWAWIAPEWIAESRSLQPTRVMIVWPETQTLAMPKGRVEIESARFASLLDVRPGPSMELREAAAEIDDLRIRSTHGWEAGAGRVSIGVAERPERLGPAHAYDMRLTATDLTMPGQAADRIGRTGGPRPSAASLTVLGHAAFDDPLDRLAIEQGRLALRAMTIREADLLWGDMRLMAKGALTVGDDGYPEGDIRVEATEWCHIARLAALSELIDHGTARVIADAVEFIAALAGTGDKPSLPLALSKGKIWIGPLAIADAPRLAPSK